MSTMQFTQIKETSLYVKDLEATEKFYREVMQLPVITRMAGRHVFLRAGSSVLLCFLRDVKIESAELPVHYGSGQMHIAFEADAVHYARWKERLQQYNIEIEHTARWPSGKESFYFRDPDGHLLEIAETLMWGF